ncbi:hypothetical protein B0H15DRAFT_942659 [Mycena belliarum]|uniref:Uncharacterized protein n=1 Tax=Mycena belliarum TaxID=1033014 RepID=A0AAD6XU29_9AGAR|nr:hypothetical protein B0H15DRAFT_942659 [Mycena belliae]
MSMLYNVVSMLATAVSSGLARSPSPNKSIKALQGSEGRNHDILFSPPTRYFRVENRFDTLACPDDDGCAPGAPAPVAGVENCAYMLCVSRGDWWREENALGDVAPAGNSP